MSSNPEFDRTDTTPEATLSLPPVSRAKPAPLHEQVAAEIRRAIAEGEAKPGQRIPQARDLAAELGVNSNTVLRALRMLRDEGLVEMGRGRSIRVAGTQERSLVLTRATELLEFARKQGYERDELIAILSSLS
ncbi:GntR family transcriptional regulator [Ferrimicrobium sp.]|uniref:GntR family transcriptional regulator n=1 Tax=Ferrimicrobium sp. TaxID=2926050 RepID=UPI00261A6AD6|nr:GntR family transcriptional regulator [Ferrimicrobium sp.]